jgi:hypothetical protein
LVVEVVEKGKRQISPLGELVATQHLAVAEKVVQVMVLREVLAEHMVVVVEALLLLLLGLVLAVLGLLV